MKNEFKVVAFHSESLPIDINDSELDIIMSVLACFY